MELFCPVDKCGSESRFKEHHVQNNGGEEIFMRIDSICFGNIWSISWDFANKGLMIDLFKKIFSILLNALIL